MGGECFTCSDDDLTTFWHRPSLWTLWWVLWDTWQFGLFCAEERDGDELLWSPPNWGCWVDDARKQQLWCEAEIHQSSNCWRWQQPTIASSVARSSHSAKDWQAARKLNKVFVHGKAAASPNSAASQTGKQLLEVDSQFLWLNLSGLDDRNYNSRSPKSELTPFSCWTKSGFRCAGCCVALSQFLYQSGDKNYSLATNMKDIDTMNALGRFTIILVVFWYFLGPKKVEVQINVIIDLFLW